jgi:hypothetical protein
VQYRVFDRGVEQMRAVQANQQRFDHRRKGSL